MSVPISVINFVLPVNAGDWYPYQNRHWCWDWNRHWYIYWYQTIVFIIVKNTCHKYCLCPDTWYWYLYWYRQARLLVLIPDTGISIDNRHLTLISAPIPNADIGAVLVINEHGFRRTALIGQEIFRKLISYNCQTVTTQWHTVTTYKLYVATVIASCNSCFVI